MKKAAFKLFYIAGFAIVLSLMIVNMQARAQNTAIPNNPLSQTYPDMTIGNQSAPMVLEVFISLTCSHCANFELNHMPQIKDEFVDTGKLLVVYRDFPLDSRAETMHLLARCLAAKDGPRQYAPFIDTLFAQQNLWAMADDFVAEVYRYARFAGLNEKEVQSCFQNDVLYQAILDAKAYASSEYGINSTPSFRLNGRVLRDLSSLSDVASELRDELLVVESN